MFSIWYPNIDNFKEVGVWFVNNHWIQTIMKSLNQKNIVFTPCTLKPDLSRNLPHFLQTAITTAFPHFKKNESQMQLILPLYYASICIAGMQAGGVESVDLFGAFSEQGLSSTSYSSNGLFLQNIYTFSSLLW